MSKVVEIADIRKKEIHKQELRMLDVRASYTVLENATKYLGMNNLPELKPVKSEIKKAMLDLRKILQNGR